MATSVTVPGVSFTNGKSILPLDESLYDDLVEEDREFIKNLTGICSNEELKTHVIRIQKKAYEVYGFPSIRHFTFARLAISRHPRYQHALRLIQGHTEPIFLEIGCGFGSDIRKVVTDGWPAKNAIASELIPAFWDLGHELFKSSPSTFPVTYVPGDVFTLLTSEEPLARPRPTSLSSLSFLNPLHGHVSAIFASWFFHMFDEDKQLDLARRLAGLLSPEPGSIIFGLHYVRKEKGSRKEVLTPGDNKLFWHSPESWRRLWDGLVFKEGTVEVEVEYQEDVSMQDVILGTEPIYPMHWSVMRL